MIEIPLYWNSQSRSEKISLLLLSPSEERGNQGERPGVRVQCNMDNTDSFKYTETMRQEVINSKRIYIIAGPNGAGKTTFAREFLPFETDCRQFVNADLIAAGLSPFAPEAEAVKAGRLMLGRIDELVNRGESFAIESTLAGRNYAKAIPQWQSLGYHVTLYFLSLSDPEMAIARVTERVRQGGHSLPEATIRRRYIAGRTNFDEIYRELVDEWHHYDNSELQLSWIESGENR